MGESQQEQLRLEFDARVRLESVGSTITSDAGLLAHRELDEKLELAGMAGQFLQEQRSGRKVRHHPVAPVRQWVYSRGGRCLCLQRRSHAPDGRLQSP